MAAKTVINEQDLAKSQVLVPRLTAIGRATEDCIKVIAIWLWLESKWNIEFITGEISTRDDEFLGLVSDEAAIIYSSVMAGSNEPIPSNLMKHTLSLSKRFLSLSSVLSDKDMVLKGISDIYLELCRVHDIKYPNSGSKSKLNPCAKEWHPVKERAPEEDRCLFLTFSNGYPLTEFQIVRFFSRKYGECVERVYVHWPETRDENRQSPALFGKVVFKASYIPALILGGQCEAKFWVDHKPLWCKKFDREKKKTS